MLGPESAEAIERADSIRISLPSQYFFARNGSIGVRKILSEL